MATVATVQVPSSSVDVAGVSSTTSTRTVANPRNGAIYNPTTLAAAVPVWFHRLQDGRYLALFSRRWTNATPTYHDGPQMFTAHTDVVGPCYAIVDPTTGNIDGPYPMKGLPLTTTLTGATTRGSYLFLAGTKDNVAHVWHFFITDTGGLQLQAEEDVPLGYRLGVSADKNYLYVWGRHTSGQLARVRKNWGRIGNNNDPNMQWQYEGDKGWLTDATTHTPMNPGLPADGPVSVATYRDRTFAAVTQHLAGAYSAQIYTQRTVEQTWLQMTSETVFLGADADYLGGGMYLQDQLVAVKSLVPDGANTGIPYVTSVLVRFSSDQAILTDWALLAV